MNDNNSILRVGPEPGRLPALGQAEREPEQADLYRMARRALRGRYALALALGAVTAAAGAAIGWRKGAPLYRSEGLIHIAYQRPSFEPDGQYRPWESFQAYVQSQQALMSSRDVLDKALLEPAWKATGLGDSPQAVAQFAGGLKVEFKANTDHLRVSFLDSSPTVAAAAVNSIIDAYVHLNAAERRQIDQRKATALQEQRDQVSGRLETIRQSMRQLAASAGSADVTQLYDASARQVGELQKTLNDIQLALLLARGESAPATLSVDQIAALDPLMRDYLATQDRLEQEMDRLRAHGYGPKYPAMIQTSAELEKARARVQKYATDFRALRAAMASSAMTTSPAGGGGQGVLSLAMQPIDTLKKSEAAVQNLYNTARRQMETLGTQRVDMDAMRAQASALEKDLLDLNHRLDMQRLESDIDGPISVIGRGEVPIAPFTDRRLLFAAAGGISGACLPAALLLALGLANTRYRYSDETEADLALQTPLLGILPVLPEGLIDPERAAEAAQCVHQIRAMLQIRAPRDRRPVYLVSSASPGEGKTSLTAALGLSFAAAGSRTLVIDCDLVGQRLTQEFEGEKLTGVHEALKTGEVADFIKATSTDGLWILPVGQADVLQASSLAVAAVERLLADARRHFDIILIDSGPIMGSVEASLIAPQADGVIFTIARGQQRPLVEKAVKHINAIGARLTGMVFNRAEPNDFHHSLQGTSLRSVSGRLVVSRGGSEPNQPSRHGPVARSVASFLPQIQTGDTDRY